MNNLYAQHHDFSRLDALPMSEHEREQVNAYIHDGEVLAELMYGALAGLRAGVELAERGIKALFPTHVRH